MNNNQIAKNFAAGATSGKGSNLFIEGCTIFSYGYRFPVARREPGGGFWFNPQKYSQSTSRHQKLVAQACQLLQQSPGQL